MQETDRGLLKTAVGDARRDCVVTVLIPDLGWSHCYEIATALVAIAEVEDFPHTDCRSVRPRTFEDQGMPFSFEQSAAVRARSRAENLQVPGGRARAAPVRLLGEVVGGGRPDAETRRAHRLPLPLKGTPVMTQQHAVAPDIVPSWR